MRAPSYLGPSHAASIQADNIFTMQCVLYSPARAFRRSSCCVVGLCTTKSVPAPVFSVSPARKANSALRTLSLNWAPHLHGRVELVKHQTGRKHPVLGEWFHFPDPYVRVMLCDFSVSLLRPSVTVYAALTCFVVPYSYGKIWIV